MSDSRNFSNFFREHSAVVKSFNLVDAKGKKVYVHDQHDTPVDTIELLIFLLQTQSASLILKIEFVENNPVQEDQDGTPVITSQV